MRGRRRKLLVDGGWGDEREEGQKEENWQLPGHHSTNASSPYSHTLHTHTQYLLPTETHASVPRLYLFQRLHTFPRSTCDIHHICGVLLLKLYSQASFLFASHSSQQSTHRTRDGGSIPLREYRGPSTHVVAWRLVEEMSEKTFKWLQITSLTDNMSL